MNARLVTVTLGAVGVLAAVACGGQAGSAGFITGEMAADAAEYVVCRDHKIYRDRPR